MAAESVASTRCANDQYVDLGPVGHSSGDGEYAPDDRRSRVQSDIADPQQVGPNLPGQVHQRVYRTTLDRPVLDVLRPGRLCSVVRIMQHRVDRRVAGYLVALGPEDVGRALIFRRGEVASPDDQLRVGFSGDHGRTIYRAQ